MPQCTRCMGEDFDIKDGFYICTLCSTQSQEYREETADDDYHEGGFSSRLKVRTKQLRNKNKNYGVKWSTYDAFTVILKSQANAVISLGASPQLKKTVLNLWITYLTKLNVISLNSNFRNKVKVNLRERDLSVFYTNKDKIPFKRKKPKLKRRGQNMTLLAEQSLKRCRKLAAEKPKAVNDSESEVSDYLDTISSYSERSDDSETENVKRHHVISSEILNDKKPNKSNHLRIMTLSRTMSFIYLGLLLCREQILLCDLIRWTWEGLIPYYQAAKEVLPDYMIFQGYDNKTFKAYFPLTSEYLRMDTGRLAQFLIIKELPTKCIQQLSARFIKELNLPVVMTNYVNNLISIHPPKMRWTSKEKVCFHIPNYEGRAVAFIMVALKLLFGLNDVDEWKKSKYAEELKRGSNLMLNKNEVPFVWRDWIKQLAHKIDLQSVVWQRTTRKYKYEKFFDIESLASFFANEGNCWRGRYCLTRRKIATTESDEVWNALCEPFRRLLRDTTDVMQVAEGKATSFPLITEPKQSLRGDKEFENFEKCSLNYLSPTSIAENDNPELNSSWQKKYHKCLKSYTRYDINKLLFYNKLKVLSSTEQPLSHSFYCLLKLMARVTEMNAESLYREFNLIENMLFRKDQLKRGRNTWETLW